MIRNERRRPGSTRFLDITLTFLTFLFTSIVYILKLIFKLPWEMALKLFEQECLCDFFEMLHVVIACPLAYSLFASVFSLLVVISIILLPIRILIEISIHVALKIRESRRNEDRSDKILERLRRDMAFI